MNATDISNKELHQSVIMTVSNDPGAPLPTVSFIEVPLQPRSVPKKDIKFTRFADTLRSSIFKFLMRLGDRFLDSCVLRIVVCLSSMMAAFCRIYFEGFLVSEFKNELILGLIIPCFIVSLIFLFVNTMILYDVIALNKLSTQKVVAYAVTVHVYLGLFVASSVCVSGYLDNLAYWISSYVVFGITLNVIGACTVFYGAVLVVYYLLLPLQNLINYLLYEGNPGAEKERRPPQIYHAYYYDRTRTSVVSCSVCLNDFQTGSLVCVGKCSELHIVHEICLKEWLKLRSTCPLCNEPANFYCSALRMNYY
eukprot:TRINITY_DN10684_c0_g1_i2.p1 TRINITY_DN10684_c0_g1~~TRINITY_DN10684_c0_g1_i2.p1  ORF type:complete len:308 (+),score=-27.23 TRINITY_DN10684_c0_g1_i2:255-1178(+)